MIRFFTLTLTIALLAAPALAAPPRPAPKTPPKPAVRKPAVRKPAVRKPATKKPAAKKPAAPKKKPTGKRAARVGEAKKLLAQASAASRQQTIKRGIAETQALLDRKQFDPARAKVNSLKQAAALAGDNSAAVLKLVQAEEQILALANNQKRKK